MILLISLPFIWWFAKWRKEESFFKWIGLYKPKLTAKWWVVAVFAALYALNYFFDYRILIPEADVAVLNAKNAVSTLSASSFGSVTASFIVNVFANGLCEEVFFRGFITKRAISKTGFWPGVLLPSALFAIVHNILWIAGGLDISIMTHIIMFMMTFAGAILLAYINERIFNGSIIPSFLLHGLGNFFG